MTKEGNKNIETLTYIVDLNVRRSLKGEPAPEILKMVDRSTWQYTQKDALIATFYSVTLKRLGAIH